jgi:hypothetical protein
VCDQVAMASRDELRDYRIPFRWDVPAVEAFSRGSRWWSSAVAASGTETRPTTVMPGWYR